MKNQYFGDINDYRKYGLLRCVIDASNLRMCVGWMLTKDDGSTDGKFTAYLDLPTKWSRHDPSLFQSLQNLSEKGRRVSLIESTSLIPHAVYYTDHVPDAAGERDAWFKSLSARAKKSDMVFLDPDNGLAVKSTPYGSKKSSKFLYWHEVEALWAAGKSLLIYQHFIREKRSDYIQRMMVALRQASPGSLVEAFSTPHVVFLMALQPRHQSFHGSIVHTVQERWAGQIHHWDLVRSHIELNRG